ncbi:hypothetical protein C8R47DRAFT_1077076 [Mycena vitilis]|nr:hypothetical protein C8R47DRAFT_1077076 [Mycena vitilis]
MFDFVELNGSTRRLRTNCAMTSLASTELEDSKRGNEVTEKNALEPVLEEAEVGYQLYKEAIDEGVTWNAENEGAVRRKIDLYILPCFCLTQGLAFLDKTALNYANLFGIKAYGTRMPMDWTLTWAISDLHITTAQFSWFASIFYIGYLVSAEPMTWLLQRYPTGRVLGVDDRSQQVVCRDYGQSFHSRMVRSVNFNGTTSMRSSLHESAAQRSPPPPFPPALDLDHDGAKRGAHAKRDHLDVRSDGIEHAV